LISINAQQLQNIMQLHPEMILLNVRPEGTSSEGWIPKSQHLPQSELAARVEAMVPNKATPLVVYGADIACSASSRAVVSLERLGYSQVYDLCSGLKGWKQEGFPLIFRQLE
jgi:rhodanese-related sulfurtransferase